MPNTNIRKISLPRLAVLCLRMLSAPLRTGWAFIVFSVAAFLLNYYFTRYPRPEFWGHVWLMGLDLYVAAALFHILPTKWRCGAKAVWYVLMYALGFVESFLYRRFYIIFDAMALMLGAETDGGEATEFLQSAIHSKQFWPCLWPWLLLISVHVLTFILAIYRRQIAARCRLKTDGVIRRVGIAVRCVLGASVLGYMVWQGCRWIEQRQELFIVLTGDTTGHVESRAGNVVYSPALRLAAAMKLYSLAQDETSRLAERMQHLRVDTCEYRCPRIVVVIGESYNKHHSQVYGYPYATTPYQAQFVRRGTMVAFTDVLTPWNLTSNVFKNMLSTHSADQDGSWTDGVLFPALFREAGYRVNFLTNQFTKRVRQDRADFSGSFFLNDVRFDSLCFDHRNTRRYTYDNALLQELPASARLPKGTKGELLIFHLRGQHMIYAKRFPRQRAVFEANDYDRPDLTQAERQIIADYDNATLYNDEIIARLCGYFKDEDALVICLADHGDEVYDGTIGMHGRNHLMELTPAIARGEFEIPLQMWGSRKFRRRHRTLWRQIRSCCDRPFMIDDLPHLLLGLAGIHCPEYDSTRDLLSPDYNAARRRPLKDGAAYYEDLLPKP